MMAFEKIIIWKSSFVLESLPWIQRVSLAFFQARNRGAHIHSFARSCQPIALCSNFDLAAFFTIPKCPPRIIIIVTRPYRLNSSLQCM